MKKLLSLLACVGALVVLSACNTVDGVGEDVEAAGESIQRAAD